MTDIQTSTPATPARPASPVPTRGERVSTIIIGAGQSGLTTAYFLGRAGHRCVVLHQDVRVGDQWRHRYDSLRLNTPAKYDRLPGIEWPVGRWDFPTGAQMGDLLEAYVAQYEMDVRDDTHVARVERVGDTFVVTTDRGTFEADSVVVATGGEHHPRTPDLARSLDPGIRQLHSSGYHNTSQLLPGPVLVVGAGQSGADIAMEVKRAGHETWLSGKPVREVPVDIESRRARIAAPILFFLAHHVLTMKTKRGRRMQPEVRNGAAPLIRVKLADLADAGVHHLEARTTGVQDGKPQLADGTVLDVANVVWCTGFRQDFSFIHPSVVGEDGWPRDEGGVVPEMPGLYFMGLLFQRGFYSMLIGGAGRDARFIADHVLREARARR
jgi:putative flavoprotein involved in K+ transport